MCLQPLQRPWGHVIEILVLGDQAITISVLDSQLLTSRVSGEEISNRGNVMSRLMTVGDSLNHSGSVRGSLT